MKQDENSFKNTHNKSVNGATPKNGNRITSILTESNHKNKLTMGLKSYQEIKEAHLKRINTYQGSEGRENQECTFQPKINNANKQKRSLTKFLKDQEKFLLSKQQKIHQLRTQINKTEEDQNTGRPLIDNKSQLISQHLNSTIRSTNIFQRLSRQKANNSNFHDQQELFTPKILSRSKSMIRKQNVSTLLYEDAKRRHQKQSFKQNQLTKRRDVSPKINSNTNVLVGRKVCSQFTELVTEEEVNPLVAISVLSEIFNVDLNPNKNTTNQTLCKKILSFLITSKTEIVKAQRLWNFVQIIINGHLINSGYTHQEEQQIIDQFQYFYSQRLTKQKKAPSPQKYPFKPKTLANSTRLADNYRQKACQKVNDFIQNQKINIVLKDGNMTIQDLFIIDHLKRQVSNEKKRIQRQNKQMQQCSFKPDVSPSKSTLKNLNKKPKIVIKMPPKGNCANRRNQGNNESNVNANTDNELNTNNNMNNTNSTTNNNLNSTNKTLQYSLKSDSIYLNRNRQRSGSKGDSLSKVKNIQKTILRMSIGRQNREYQNSFLERGYPKNGNWVQSKYQKQKELVRQNQQLKGYGLTTK